MQFLSFIGGFNKHGGETTVEYSFGDGSNCIGGTIVTDVRDDGKEWCHVTHDDDAIYINVDEYPDGVKSRSTEVLVYVNDDEFACKGIVITQTHTQSTDYCDLSFNPSSVELPNLGGDIDFTFRSEGNNCTDYYSEGDELTFAVSRGTTELTSVTQTEKEFSYMFPGNMSTFNRNIYTVTCTNHYKNNLLLGTSSVIVNKSVANYVIGYSITSTTAEFKAQITSINGDAGIFSSDERATEAHLNPVVADGSIGCQSLYTTDLSVGSLLGLQVGDYLWNESSPTLEDLCIFNYVALECENEGVRTKLLLIKERN